MVNTNSLFDLRNKVALVTGASSGLGRRAAIVLSAAGAKVIGVARRRNALEELRQEIASFFNETGVKNEKDFMVRDRHVKIFMSVTKNLEQAIQGLNNKKTLELVAEDLKNARSDLDELIGRKFSDSLLGDIFSSFCIGK